MAPNYRITHNALTMSFKNLLSVDLTYISTVNMTLLCDVQVLRSSCLRTYSSSLWNTPLAFEGLAKNYLVFKVQLQITWSLKKVPGIWGKIKHFLVVSYPGPYYTTDHISIIFYFLILRQDTRLFQQELLPVFYVKEAELALNKYLQEVIAKTMATPKIRLHSVLLHLFTPIYYP